jgi:hypothetical protein
MIIGVRVLQIGEETLAYGISSIITYVAFLIWSQVTAPSGEAAVPAFGEVIPLASSLMLAYSVATVVSQNIFKNENREDFLKLVGYTFLWGILIYTFITLGSFCKHPLIQPLSIASLSTRTPRLLRTILRQVGGRWQ